MLFLPRAVKVYVATAPCNLRRSFDGLSNEVRAVLAMDPLSGHVFVFLNRRKTQGQLLLWTRGGCTITGGRVHFQGGQTPMQRRLPKRGFRNPFPAKVAEVNVGELEAFDAGSAVDEAILRTMGFVKGRADRLKILGDGDLTKKLTVRAHSFSKSAQANTALS